MDLGISGRRAAVATASGAGHVVADLTRPEESTRFAHVPGRGARYARGRVGSDRRDHDFGAIVAFRCSRQAGFLTGTAVPVDGGAYRALL